MIRASVRLVALTSAIITIVVGSSTVQAEPHFLVIGGGYSPLGNQVSLERNVIYFDRVLNHLNLTENPRSLYFACGQGTQRDLVYLAPWVEPVPIRRLLAEIVGPSRDANRNFRHHDVGGGEQASNRKNIKQWFDDHSPKLDADDTAFIYFTGHGGKEDGSTQNTSMYLWNNDAFRMRDFTTELNKLDEETPVVLVMVQCYAGGFANVIFEDGDPDKGLASYNRCGFFATVHSRTAAGCTPNVNEADYKEYSSYFWAALCGEDRVGQPVVKPDFNNDGKVSFNEAHAFALIESDSVDVSIKTSDRFLRHYSKTNSNESSEEQEDVPPPADEGDAVEGDPVEGDEPVSTDTPSPGCIENENPADQLTMDSPYVALLIAANDPERHTLEGLSKKLNLTGVNRVKESKELIKELEKQKREVRKKLRPLQSESRKIQGEIKKAVVGRFPILSNPWHEEVNDLVNARDDEIRKIIESHAKFKRFLELQAEIATIEEEAEQFDGDIARCRRFEYVSESVVLAANLSTCQPEEIVTAYHQLCLRESASLQD